MSVQSLCVGLAVRNPCLYNRLHTYASGLASIPYFKLIHNDGEVPFDLVSGNDLTDTSAGSVYYIHPTTGELVTVAATEVLNHPTLGITSLPEYEQLCQDSEDPGEWVLGGATMTATGETFGPFIEYALSGDQAYKRAYIWESGVSGALSGILYFNIRYRPGTSGEIYIQFKDVTGGGATYYIGVIGSASIVAQGSSGVLTIISDAYDSDLGYYVLTGSIVYTNLSNSLNFALSSNSADNKSIKVLGADVSEDRAILDFHVPSGPATGNVIIASRAGTAKAADLATNFPKLYNALDGGGSTAASRIAGVWTPGVDWADAADVTQNILTVSAAAMLSFRNFSGIAGALNLFDGTTTITTDAINWVSGTKYPFEIVYGPNTALAADKMQLNVKVSGVWISVIGDFDGSFDPTADMIFGRSNSYQSSVSGLKSEKLKQSHWRS